MRFAKEIPTQSLFQNLLGSNGLSTKLKKKKKNKSVILGEFVLLKKVPLTQVVVLPRQFAQSLYQNFPIHMVLL